MKRELVQRIRDLPTSILTCECVLAFGAFVVGYKTANPGSAALFRKLAQRYIGPDQADACTRAYLASRDTREALRSVLDSLEIEIESSDEAMVPHMSIDFANSIRGPILEGRWGMVLGEPSVMWLADYAAGYISGIHDVDAAAGLRQQEQLASFATWLCSRYGEWSAPWHGMIRIFEGANEHGLLRFLELWDEYNSSHSQN